MENAPKKTILVVEDEPAYRRILTEKFELSGFTVLNAKDGEEGLAIALEQHPDLILLDLAMPKMDGITMGKQLRDDSWGKTAKIIILTALGDVENIQKALESDIFHYFIKSDMKLEDLVKKVQEMLK